MIPTAHAQKIVLHRDVVAIRVPDGTPTSLRSGDEVTITQELGSSYTLSCPGGYMVRLDAVDADAIGRIAKDLPGAHHLGPITKDVVYRQLETVYDPEIPVNVVDLGLIYTCDINIKDNGYDVRIEMTLTAPGCGMGPVLQDDVHRKVAALPGVVNVDVELVFDPPWDREMMSEVARLELGMM